MGGGAETQNNGSQWYTIRVIKPIRMFDIHVNEEFSLLQKTGLTVGKGWKNPYILYSYKELISNQFLWDGKLKLTKINDDKYILNTVDNSIDNKSLITILVMESDEQGNVYTNSTNIKSTQSHKWNTIEKISPKFKRYKLVDLNKSNNYTFDISDMNINPNTMQVMYFIEEMPYLSSCYHIKIDLINISPNMYQTKLYQKYCETQQMIHKNAGYNNTQNDTLTNVGSCRYEIDMESNEENIVIDNFFSISIGQTKIGQSRLQAYCGGGYVSYCTALTEELYFKGKNTNITISIAPQNSNLTYTYKLYSYYSSNNFHELSDYKLKLFILGEEI